MAREVKRRVVNRRVSKYKQFKRGYKQKYKQTGKRKSISRDAERLAKPVGWRRSASGNLYFESRKNRSDKIKKYKGHFIYI